MRWYEGPVCAPCATPYEMAILQLKSPEGCQAVEPQPQQAQGVWPLPPHFKLGSPLRHAAETHFYVVTLAVYGGEPDALVLPCPCSWSRSCLCVLHRGGGPLAVSDSIAATQDGTTSDLHVHCCPSHGRKNARLSHAILPVPGDHNCTACTVLPATRFKWNRKPFATFPRCLRCPSDS